jgi:hypothetical protein
MRLPSLFVALACVGLASCDGPGVDNSAEQGQVSAPESKELAPAKTPVTIRTTAGGPKEKAYLVEPTLDVPLDQLADGVRETGYLCDAVTAFNQLEQNDQRMDVYKIDCEKRSYQVTILNGHTHIKPWTGNLIGS